MPFALPQNRIFTFKQLTLPHTDTPACVPLEGTFLLSFFYCDQLFVLVYFPFSHFMPFNLLFTLCFCHGQLNSALPSASHRCHWLLCAVYLANKFTNYFAKLAW